ncbi:MAG: helix-turn-helix domain-containing protein [Anaerolineae bacterium]|nr:helix-turn-helix domain-containing protein [Anaerolineae bacterium]
MSFPYPAASAVKGRVLGALLRGELLTHADCWRRLGSSRLAHHVHVLRRAGWPVKAMETIVRTSDAGRPATIAEYFLDQTVIEEVGEEGQRYAEQCLRVELERRAA